MSAISAGLPARARRAMQARDSMGVWAALVLLFGISALAAPGTLAGTAIASMLPFAGVLVIVAVGQTLVIQQRGIDLSVPGMMSMAAVVVTRFADGNDGRLLAAIVLAMSAAAAAGLLSGLVITKLRVTPIVATLGVNALLVGIASSISGDIPTSAAPALSSFALAKSTRVSNTALIALAIAILTAAVIARTVLGRRFVACGVAPSTARASGLAVPRYVLGGYIAAAACYAAAAILLAGYVQTPSTATFQDYLLSPIAAVVIGGTALGAGKASVAGSVGGAIFLSQLTQLILGLGAPSATQLLVQAGAIGVAVGLRTARPARLRRSQSRSQR